MYKIVKNVINNGNYDLADIIHKIKTLWISKDLTDDEYNELIKRARASAKTENSIDILAKLEELDKRLSAIENVTVNTEEFPEYVVGKYYYNGDKCSFEGNSYTCIAPDGVVCVWSPIEYPSYWAEE